VLQHQNPKKFLQLKGREYLCAVAVCCVRVEGPGGAEAGASAHSRASSTGNTQTERSAQQTERSSRRPAPRRPPGCTTDRTVYRAGISRHGWLRPPYKYKNVNFCEEILLI